MRLLTLIFIALGLAVNAQSSRLQDFGNKGRIIDSVPGAFSSSARQLKIYQNYIYTLVTGSFNTMAVYSYDQFGKPNSDFSGDGFATFTANGASSGPKMAMDANGNIYLVACTTGVCTVIKINIYGEQVSDFGINGTLTLSFGGQLAGAIVKDAALSIGFSNYSTVSVVRISTTNGAFDTGFDGDGRADLTISGGGAYSYGMDMDPVGNIFQFGYLSPFSGTQTGLVTKFSTNGADTTFGSNGLALAPAPVSEFQTGKVAGQNVLGAGGYNAGYVASFNAATGEVNTSFGSGGIVVIGDATTSLYESFRSIIIFENGDIFVGGDVLDISDYDQDALFARFTSSGSLVSTFGSNGIYRVITENDNEYIYQVAAFNGNDVVAAGNFENKFLVTYFYEEGATPDFPTAFSPNEDGLNDFLAVRNIHAANDNRLVVYDREGNMVYDTEDYKNDWKGLNNNKNVLSDGVYYYVFTYNNDKKIKNFLEIRR